MTVSARSGDAVNANGNQVTRTVGGVSYTFVYDYNNRLTEVKQGETVLAAFVYDADGERVLGSVGGVTTVYVGGVYEYVVGTGATTHYYEGNALRRTGHAGDNGVFYLLQDHLHSSSALAAQNGTLSGARNYYYPFGGSRGGVFNGLTAKRFTGQYHEATIPGGEGLSYYGARWYDARLGRFITPDSIVPNPANPQDFNRYAYVRNNPVRYIDANGHEPIDHRNGPCSYMACAEWGGEWTERGGDFPSSGREQGDAGPAVDGFQTTLDVAGVFDPSGIVDTFNAAVYAARGQWRNAGITLAGVVPVIGDGLKTLKLGKTARMAIEGGADLARLTPADPKLLTSALSSFFSRGNNRYLSIGNESIALSREAFEHILSRHHPLYWAGDVRNANSAFAGSATLEDVYGLLQATLRTGTRTPNGKNRYFVVAMVNGQWYRASVDYSYVKQFYPCRNAGCR